MKDRKALPATALAVAGTLFLLLPAARAADLK
jgi:hypothetical protein